MKKLSELSFFLDAAESAVTRLNPLTNMTVNEDPGLHGMDLAIYIRDTVFTAMNAVRAVSDRLEKLVADDLWPLPKYSEILFIK